jgi:Leucyl-tRNA synthetase, Domain 2
MKKLFLASLLLISQLQADAEKSKIISLSCPLLRVADNAGVFHGPIIVDILQTRIDIVNLVQGLKTWNGAIMHLEVADSHETLTIYCRRPELICGAGFITISPDHELAMTIATHSHQHAVQNYITKTLTKNLYDRQMHATLDSVFTGSYAINPFTQERLPIYVSDYAVESFDIHHGKTRLGVPAHNSRDYDFAKQHNLPINSVVDVKESARGKKGESEPLCALPLLDKHGKLTEAYLGEYSSCILIHSKNLNNLSLKDAASNVIDFLVQNNCGQAYTELLQYEHNGQQYSIKDLAKIETAVYKNNVQNSQINELKDNLKITLNYAQADFFEIVEKFLINAKNTKTLMVALINEDCELRNNSECYLLRWSKLPDDTDAKEAFRRDITSMKELTIFCKDLVNFLGDFAHSCPKALQNIRNQNS